MARRRITEQQKRRIANIQQQRRDRAGKNRAKTACNWNNS